MNVILEKYPILKFWNDEGFILRLSVLEITGYMIEPLECYEDHFNVTIYTNHTINFMVIKDDVYGQDKIDNMLDRVMAHNYLRRKNFA